MEPVGDFRFGIFCHGVCGLLHLRCRGGQSLHRARPEVVACSIRLVQAGDCAFNLFRYEMNLKAGEVLLLWRSQPPTEGSSSITRTDRYFFSFSLIGPASYFGVCATDVVS